MLLDKILRYGIPPSEVGCVSDRGLVREANEDSALSIISGDGRWHILVVCDGMGGHFGGKTASSIAAETVSKSFFASLGTNAPALALKAAVSEANQSVRDKAQSDQQLNGMGTTVVVLATDSQNAFIAHVGDSRCYRIRKTEITRMTTDHSNVQRLVDAGMLTPAEALTHPDNNVLYRCVGQSDNIEVEVTGPVPVQAGDRFLLCSDGLHGLVEDKIIGAMALMYSAKEGAFKLVELAKSRGGHDNVSVALYHRTDSNRPTGKFLPDRLKVFTKFGQSSAVREDAEPRKLSGVWIAAVASLVTMILTFAGLYFWNHGVFIMPGRNGESNNAKPVEPVTIATVSPTPMTLESPDTGMATSKKLEPATPSAGSTVTPQSTVTTKPNASSKPSFPASPKTTATPSPSSMTEPVSAPKSREKSDGK